MDIIADALKMDPLEIRRKNILQKGDSFSTGEPMPEMHYNELLESAAEKIGWNDGPIVVREGNKMRQGHRRYRQGHGYSHNIHSEHQTQRRRQSQRSDQLGRNGPRAKDRARADSR